MEEEEWQRREKYDVPRSWEESFSTQRSAFSPEAVKSFLPQMNADFQDSRGWFEAASAVCGFTPPLHNTFYISFLSHRDRDRCARFCLRCGAPAAPVAHRRPRPCAPVPARGASCGETPAQYRQSKWRAWLLLHRCRRERRPASRALPPPASDRDNGPCLPGSAASWLRTCRMLPAYIPPGDRAGHIRASRCLLSGGPCSAGGLSTADRGC